MQPPLVWSAGCSRQAGQQGVAQETVVVAAAGARLGWCDRFSQLPGQVARSLACKSCGNPDLACCKTLENSPSRAFLPAYGAHSSYITNKSSYALTDLLRSELCRKRAVVEAAHPSTR